MWYLSDKHLYGQGVSATPPLGKEMGNQINWSLCNKFYHNKMRLLENLLSKSTLLNNLAFILPFRCGENNILLKIPRTGI